MCSLSNGRGSYPERRARQEGGLTVVGAPREAAPVHTLSLRSCYILSLRNHRLLSKELIVVVLSAFPDIILLSQSTFYCCAHTHLQNPSGSRHPCFVLAILFSSSSSCSIAKLLYSLTFYLSIWRGNLLELFYTNINYFSQRIERNIPFESAKTANTLTTSLTIIYLIEFS